MGMASQSAAAAEINPSAGHHDAVADKSGEQGSASAKSTGRDNQKSGSDQAASPKRATTSDHEGNVQSAPRRAYSEFAQASSDGDKSVSSYSSYNRKSSNSTNKKSSYNSKISTNKKSSSTNKKSSSTNKKSSSTNKKYSSTSKKSYGSTSSKKRSGYSKNSYNGGTRSGNYSYTRSSSGPSSSSSSSSTSSATSSDAAAPSSSTTTANGAAAPLAKGSYRIGAAFGATGSWSRYHTGQDFAASSGTPVYAVTSGTVISGNVGSWAGNYVVIRAADGSSTLYAHMSGTDVKVGQQVTAGQKIGNVGSTGRSFGAHLHFEYYPSGVTPGDVYSATNPMSYLRSIGISM